MSSGRGIEGQPRRRFTVKRVATVAAIGAAGYLVAKEFAKNRRRQEDDAQLELDDPLRARQTPDLENAAVVDPIISEKDKRLRKLEVLDEIVDLPDTPIVAPEILSEVVKMKKGTDGLKYELTQEVIDFVSTENGADVNNGFNTWKAAKDRVDRTFDEFAQQLADLAKNNMEGAGFEVDEEYESYFGVHDPFHELVVKGEILGILWNQAEFETKEDMEGAIDDAFQKLEKGYARISGYKALDKFLNSHDLGSVEELMSQSPYDVATTSLSELKDIAEAEEYKRYEFDEGDDEVSHVDYLVKLTLAQIFVNRFSFGDIDKPDSFKDLNEIDDFIKIMQSGVGDPIRKVRRHVFDSGQIAANKLVLDDVGKRSLDALEASREKAKEEYESEKNNRKWFWLFNRDGKKEKRTKRQRVAQTPDPAEKANDVKERGKAKGKKEKKSLKERILGGGKPKEPKGPSKPPTKPAKTPSSLEPKPSLPPTPPVPPRRRTDRGYLPDPSNPDIPEHTHPHEHDERVSGRRFGMGTLLASALAGAAIATGAIAVYEQFDDDNNNVQTTHTIVIGGDNIKDNYGLIDNSTGGNTNILNPGNSGDDGGEVGTVDPGSHTLGEIRLSGDMNQDLAYLVLDAKSDGKIGNGIHIDKGSASDLFKSLGVDSNVDRYGSYLDSLTDQNQLTDTIDLDRVDADKVTYIFREEDSALPADIQAGVAALPKDRTVDLALPEDGVSQPDASPVASATASATGTQAPSGSETVTPIETSTATATNTPDGSTTLTPTKTPAVNVITNTPTSSPTITPTTTSTISTARDSHREGEYALGYLAPVLGLGFAPIVARGPKLEAKANDDDEEEDGNKKNKVKQESKS